MSEIDAICNPDPTRALLDGVVHGKRRTLGVAAGQRAGRATPLAEIGAVVARAGVVAVDLDAVVLSVFGITGSLSARGAEMVHWYRGHCGPLAAI